MNVILSVPLPTMSYPAEYSPPTACLSKNTGVLYPSSTPSMWIVSRLMVMPFHPRRMAPLGEPQAFFKPSRLTWSAVGVIVGSLKMALSLAPAAMTSRRTRSAVSSRFFARRSKNSHALVSTWGSINASG